MVRVTHEINSTFATTLDHDKLVGSAAQKNRHKASRLLLSISTAARKPAVWNPVTSASKPPENYTDAFLGPAVYLPRVYGIMDTSGGRHGRLPSS